MMFFVFVLCILVLLEGLAILVLFSRYNILKDGVVDFSEALKQFTEITESTSGGIGHTFTHIYMLLDTLSGLLPPGMVQEFYMQIRNHPEMPAEKILEAKKNWSARYFTHVKSRLSEKLNEVTDPLKKDRLQKAIGSVDDLWNLVNTVDENSSPEHKAHIQAEMSRVMFDMMRNPPLDPEDMGP